MPSTKKVYQGLVAIFCIAVSISFTLVIAELGLRVFMPYRTLGSLMEIDDRIGYHHFPNANTSQVADGRNIPIRTNNVGLRQNETIAAEKKDSEYRVLLIGDSFMFGWGVPIEETFFSLIQSRARKELANRNLVFLNGGHGAFGTEQMIGYIEDRGFALKPDAIIFLMGSNDLEDNLQINDIYLEEGGKLVRNDHPTTIHANRSRLARMFPVYDWIVYNSLLFQMVRPGVQALGMKTANLNYGVPAANQPVLQREASAIANPKTLSPVALRTIKLLGYLQQKCRERNIRLRISNIPTGVGPTAEFFILSQTEFSKTGMDYIDLSSKWKAAIAKETSPLFLSNGHFTTRGNILFADVLWPVVNGAL